MYKYTNTIYVTLVGAEPATFGLPVQRATSTPHEARVYRVAIKTERLHNCDFRAANYSGGFIGSGDGVAIGQRL